MLASVGHAAGMAAGQAQTGAFGALRRGATVVAVGLGSVQNAQRFAQVLDFPLGLLHAGAPARVHAAALACLHYTHSLIFSLESPGELNE